MVKIALAEEAEDRLLDLIEKKKWKKFQREARELHPFDLGEFVQGLEEDKRVEVLTRLDSKLVAEFLPQVKEEVQSELLEHLAPSASARVLKHIPPDEAVDILSLSPREKRKEIIKHLPREVRRDVRTLLPLPADTAGGLMTTKVLALPQDTTVSQAEAYLKENAGEFETIYYLYVTDWRGKLTGVISLRELVLAPESKNLGEIMNSNVIYVDVDMEQEDVANIVADYDLAAVPVTDPQGNLSGIITVDDIVDVIEEEAVKDMGQLAGTGVKVDMLIDAPAIQVIRSRLPWLSVALIGDGLLAATILRSFEQTMASVVALSLFVPVIMTMGGNVGLQTSTIFIRGLATNEIESRLRYMLREVQIGFFMALIAGIGVSIFSLLVVDKPVVGLVVGVAMLSAMLLASIMGVVIPSIFESLDIDPAVASGPFMTTTQDITSLVVYFSLATFLIQSIS